MAYRDDFSLGKMWADLHASFKIGFTDEECELLEGFGVEIPDWSDEGEAS